MSRRKFLGLAGGAISVSVASQFATARVVKASVPDSKQVLIIGAGLAGLSAAYELNNAGYDVTVLEARSIPGGRVLTYRDPFADGLYAELGAEYIDASDEFNHRYCKKFGLKILQAKRYDGIFVRGKTFHMDSFKKNKERLPFEGTQPGVLFGQEAQYTKRLLQGIKNLDDLPDEILKLDQMSIAQLLKQEGAPQDVIELYTYLNATEETARPDEMSALSMLRSHLKQTAFSELQNEGRILGGNDQLPKAFAKSLADKIYYNCPVRKICHDQNGVEVWFEDHGTLQTRRSPLLITTIPFTVLRELEITPEFSSEKMNCIRKLAYGQGMKIAMQFKRRFWDEQGSLGQRVFTDTKLRRIYHMSIDQPGPRGILMSFTSADDASKLGHMSEAERLDTALKEVSKIWGEAPLFWEGGVSKYWNEDPWSKGSYSFTGVGQDRNFLELARKPEGRVHFAGEQTSIFRASMNGAIESGVRVCTEIQKS